jgi:hypothetical protein
MSWVERNSPRKSRPARISDIQLVLELARRLGLREAECGDLYADEFCVVPERGINFVGAEVGVRFGHGCGYGNFAVEFYFGENGNLVGHGVWE